MDFFFFFLLFYFYFLSQTGVELFFFKPDNFKVLAWKVMVECLKAWATCSPGSSYTYNAILNSGCAWGYTLAYYGSTFQSRRETAVRSSIRFEKFHVSEHLRSRNNAFVKSFKLSSFYEFSAYRDRRNKFIWLRFLLLGKNQSSKGSSKKKSENEKELHWFSLLRCDLL